MKKLLCCAVLAVMVRPVLAAPRTITLEVPGMSCAACPITVKKALTRVPGVTSARVDLERRLAVVGFDDARTGVDALVRATAAAGYPSVVVK